MFHTYCVDARELDEKGGNFSIAYGEWVIASTPLRIRVGEGLE